MALQVTERNHGPTVELDRVRAVAERGLDGDRHFGRGGRSILLMDASSLGDLGLGPGDLREQITVDLEGLQELPPGSRLRVGDAVLVITGPCEPCTHIGEHVGVEDREAFRERLRGRRGVLAAVTEVRGEGWIRLDDPVEHLG